MGLRNLLMAWCSPLLVIVIILLGRFVAIILYDDLLLYRMGYDITTYLIRLIGVGAVQTYNHWTGELRVALG